MIRKSDKDIMLEQKENDFIVKFDDMFKRLSSSNLVFKTNEICYEIAESEAPRFYVTAQQALRQYRKYKNGLSQIRRGIRRKMYADIFTRFEALYNKCGGHAYMNSIMEEVLSKPAPSFYLSRDSVICFYYRAMKKRRMKNRVC